MGLYGALIVHDEDMDDLLPDDDYVVFLDDVLLNDDGTVAPFIEDLDVFHKTEEWLNGRIGNQMLINGQYAPLTTLPGEKEPKEGKPLLKEGDEIRLRLINSANTRFMRIDFPGQDVYKVASDGGVVQEPYLIPPIDGILDPDNEDGDNPRVVSNPDPKLGLMLTPGERAEVVFAVKGPGPFQIVWHDYPVGRHNVYYDEEGVLKAGHDHLDDGKREPVVLVEWSVKEQGNDSEDDWYAPPTFLTDIDPIIPSNEEPIGYEFGHNAPADDSVFFFGQVVDGTKLHYDMIEPQDAPVVDAYSQRYVDVANMDGESFRKDAKSCFSSFIPYCSYNNNLSMTILSSQL